MYSLNQPRYYCYYCYYILLLLLLTGVCCAYVCVSGATQCVLVLFACKRACGCSVEISDGLQPRAHPFATDSHLFPIFADGCFYDVCLV
jgi:hypothetical protein